MRRLAPVCLGRNIRINIRWITGEFHNRDDGSREHDNSYVPTKSLVDHLWVQKMDSRFSVPHACSDRESAHRESDALTAYGAIAGNQDCFPEALRTVEEQYNFF